MGSLLSHLFSTWCQEARGCVSERHVPAPAPLSSHLILSLFSHLISRHRIPNLSLASPALLLIMMMRSAAAGELD